MTELLTDRAAVVTGAASGIGRAVAREFAAHGADVVCADVRESPREGGEPTHELVASETDREAAFVDCDVTDYDDVERAVAAADAFGGIDVMVNNAGVVGPQTPVVDLDVDAYRDLVAVNLDGVVHGSKAAALRMVEGGGSIVNVSSIAGITGYGGLAPYSASKGGVTLFSYALAAELGPDGVRVNVVHPGVIETAMTTDDYALVGTDEGEDLKASIPLRRFGRPAEVAGVCTFLASDLAGFVTAESVVVDGGSLNSR
ncbi:SDR family oxidoreductase [Halorarius halobius]|uniref:SDR family oxidoreductase n=1 Tax=Halorarius halobius TaxID=2962671 RepID=UPI0020CD1AAE|nr:SDR family oxidoreductase [Halorarius halobius]